MSVKHNGLCQVHLRSHTQGHPHDSITCCLRSGAHCGMPGVCGVTSNWIDGVSVLRPLPADCQVTPQLLMALLSLCNVV